VRNFSGEREHRFERVHKAQPSGGGGESARPKIKAGAIKRAMRISRRAMPLAC
jgi:hypothetical protein